MILHCLSLFKAMTSPSRRGARLRRGRRPAVLEALEDRVLLSTNPTAYTVTDTSDSAADTGSLRYAITQANANTDPAGSLIRFDPTVFSVPRTIALGSTLTLSETAGPEVIEGPGSSLLTISGNGAVEVFKVASTATTATLSGLTVSGGSAAHNGGGLDNEGTLSLTNCVVAGNSVSGGGNGGGIYNNGPLTIADSTISGNSVSGGGKGGGVANEDTTSMTDCTISGNAVSGGSGGGIDNETSLTLTGCSVTGNSASGQTAGGGIYNTNSLVVTESTIAGNSADFAAGGIYSNGMVTITDSTIANDSAGLGGGIYNYGGSLTAANDTISGNSSGVAGYAGGLITSGTAVTLENTIVALNTTAAVAGDISAINGGSVSPTSGYNLIGTGGSGGLINGVNGNQVGVANPGLGPLANNGGPTQTIALLPGSPAIDAGSNALDAGQITDQRGASLARVFNGTVDIGAYELQPASIVAVSVGWGTQTATLQTAADGLRLLPAGRNTDLPWLGVDSLQITLNEPQTLTAAEVTIVGLRGIDYGPVTVTGSGRNDTFTFQPIGKSDQVTVTIAGAGFNGFSGRLDVLPGDFNDDGVVNRKDVVGVRNEVLGKNGAKPTIFGDINGDGAVDRNDLKAAQRRLGTRLPKLRFRALARPAFRTEVRRLVSDKRLRPDSKTRGAPAAPALVSWPSQVYAPYVDMTLYPTPALTAAMSAAGIKDFTLGFVVAEPRNHQPSWGGYSTDDINGGAFDMAMRAQVSAVRQQGGDVMVSFGGAAGKELAQVITNVKQLENAYQTVITDYNLTQIDFDIEGAAEANHASINRRFRAVAALEQQAAAAGRPLNVWLTLPALPTGLDGEGMYVMQAALKYGVRLAGVNLMTMDYGNSVAPNPDEMGQYAVQAAQGLFGQLQGLYGTRLTTQQIWQMEGNTPMIGLNDVTSEVFSLQAAQELTAFAEQVGMGRISMWSLSRDVEDPKGALGSVEDTSSSIVQQPYAFSKIFLAYEN
jgi:chitinase